MVYCSNMETLSLIQISTQCNCSIHFLLKHIRNGSLKAHQIAKRIKKCWRVTEEDFLAFKAAHITGNKRVARGMMREARRVSYINKGYRYIWSPDHHRANHAGYVPEHILVMEKSLKRKILKGQDVHHINGNRADNRPENLISYNSRSEHLKDAHVRQYKARIKLAEVLKAGKKAKKALTVKEKAAIFDQLLE